MDSEAGGGRSRPGQCRSVEGLGAGPQHVGPTGDREVLREHDQGGPVSGGLVHEVAGRGQIGLPVGSGRRLDGGDAHVTG